MTTLEEDQNSARKKKGCAEPCGNCIKNPDAAALVTSSLLILAEMNELLPDGSSSAAIRTADGITEGPRCQAPNRRERHVRRARVSTHRTEHLSTADLKTGATADLESGVPRSALGR